MSENPAIEVLARERDAAAADAERLSAQVRELRTKIRALEDAIRRLQPEEGEEMAAPTGGAGTLNERVVEHLRFDGEGETPQSIADAITAEGRDTSNTTVSSILSRLRKAGKAEKRGSRWYRAKEKEPPGGGPEIEEGAGSPGLVLPTGSTPVSSTSSASGSGDHDPPAGSHPKPPAW